MILIPLFWWYIPLIMFIAPIVAWYVDRGGLGSFLLALALWPSAAGITIVKIFFC